MNECLILLKMKSGMSNFIFAVYSAESEVRSGRSQSIFCVYSFHFILAPLLEEELTFVHIYV